MTLVAIKVARDHVEVLADTLSYANQFADLAFVSKGQLLPHLEAAVFTSGPGELDEWPDELRRFDPGSERFDALDPLATAALPLLWERVNPAAWPGPKLTERDIQVGARGWVFHVGWSPSQQRFQGFEYTSCDGWVSNEITDMPLYSSLPAKGRVNGDVAPTTDAEWVQLADDLFEEYALASWHKGASKGVFGGDLILTRLDRGGVASQRRIGNIPIDDARFRRALVGTCHPSGQLGPCPCGSGGPYAVCCPGYFDPFKPCMCGSGELFGECHRIDPESIDAAEYWTEHVGDFSGPLNVPFIRERARQVNDHWEQQRAAAG